MENISDPPYQTSLVDPVKDPTNTTSYIMSVVWYGWLIDFIQRVQSGAQVLKVVSLTTQTATIPTTQIPLPSLAGGVYRVSWYARITTPASISSSLTVNLAWTESAVALSASGAAMTGNTITTVQSAGFVMQIDPATALSYSTTYASVGTPMAYLLDVIVEQLS